MIRIPPRRRALAALLLLGLFAAPPAHARPRGVLVLCDQLTQADLSATNLPHLRALAESGKVALMNTAVAGEKSPLAATLTIATGALNAPEPTDAAAYEADEPGPEPGRAREAYARRMGAPAPSGRVLLHLGIASLRARGLDRQLLAAVAAEGRGNTVSVCRLAGASDPARQVGLLGVDRDGIGADALMSAPDAAAMARWTASREGVVIAQIGSEATPRDERMRALDAYLAALWSRPDERPERLLVASPCPPPSRGGAWDRLCIAVLAEPGAAAGLLTSPTTRTRGLIANIDLAPTVLGWLGVPPPAEMTGHAIAPVADPRPLTELRRMDRLVTANARCLVPVFTILGVIIAIIGFGSLAAIALHSRRTRGFAFWLLLMMNMPAAMLLQAPIFRALLDSPVAGRTPPALLYLCTVLPVMGLMAGLESLAGKRATDTAARIRRVLLACLGVNLVLPLADAFFGQPLVKFSLFSSYQLSGIRFYGIGNEYMGVIIGAAVLVPFLARWRPAAAALMFMTVTLIMGLPPLGAKAGAWYSVAPAFGSAWMLLRGRRPTLRHAAGWAVAGFAVALVAAFIERRFAGAAATHLGGSVAAAHTLGAGYLAQVAARKALMNARIFVSPGILSALAGILVCLTVARGPLRGQLNALGTAFPELAKALPACGWGVLAALLFNDSGSVAATFLFGLFFTSGLYFRLNRPELARIMQTSGPERPASP